MEFKTWKKIIQINQKMMKIHKMMMFLQIIKIKKNILPLDLAATNHQKKIDKKIKNKKINYNFLIIQKINVILFIIYSKEIK